MRVKPSELVLWQSVQMGRGNAKPFPMRLWGYQWTAKLCPKFAPSFEGIWLAIHVSWTTVSPGWIPQKYTRDSRLGIVCRVVLARPQHISFLDADIQCMPSNRESVSPYPLPFQPSGFVSLLQCPYEPSCGCRWCLRSSLWKVVYHWNLKYMTIDRSVVSQWYRNLERMVMSN